ncbi:uncharacterized protein JCM6883_007027 [Sporobolomyces salmoneus]|uniref:uncharacterized protein n=1 Tax=Sporobolomyces salmoneus TaxID=183962 RepID=UPI00317122FD
MDRSFGSSTSTLLATPTPLERKSRSSLANNQLAQSINARPSNSLSSSSAVLQPLTFQKTALSGPTTKAVRFSPAHPSTTGAFSSAYSSAPSSRVQSIATPPRAHSSPSLSALGRSSSYGLGSGAAATPPRPLQSYQQQLGRQVQQTVHQVVETPIKAVQEIKHKLQITPIGRGEAARRLRVNAVLLVAYWVSSRTAGYRLVAGHLVALIPSLDTPLLVAETCLLFLLGWNILDSLRALQKLSALPSNQSTVSPLLVSPLTSKPGPIRSSSSISSPARSSPKTRAHPSPLVSRFVSPSKSTQFGPNTSPFRSSSLASSSPPTPQTPSSALNRNTGAAISASALSRRSLGGIVGNSPGGGGGVTSSPLGRSQSAGTMGTPKKGEEINGALLAFEARHSPSANTSPRVSLNTREEIDRLLE